MTFVPQYVSAGVVGVSSGYLLSTYVPEELEPGQQRRPELLWGLVAAASFLSPLLLVLFRSCLVREEAEEKRPVRELLRQAEEERPAAAAASCPHPPSPAASAVELIRAVDTVASPSAPSRKFGKRYGRLGAGAAAGDDEDAEGERI